AGPNLKDFTLNVLTKRKSPRKKFRLNRQTAPPAFAAKLYRQELGRHWQPRGLTKNDRLEVTRRISPEWRSGGATLRFPLRGGEGTTKGTQTRPLRANGDPAARASRVSFVFWHAWPEIGGRPAV